MRKNSNKVYSSSFDSIEVFDNRNTFQLLHKSKRYFLTDKIINHHTILDIGCSTGALGNAILEKYPNARYTGIDVNHKSIQLGRKKYKNLELIKGEYPFAINKKKYDVVIVNNLFEQIEKWKEFLLNLRNSSNKYFIIGCCLRDEGSTVIDKDLSYSYYFETGIRVHKIVHNIYELLNFCCTDEIGAERIEFYGYHIKDKKYIPGDFKPLPTHKQIRGNLMIKLKENVSSSKGSFHYKKNLNNQIRKNIKILIDNKKFTF